jgi:predicted LPLAT superfamily acyltransferase
VAIYFIPFAPKATKAVWLYNRKHLGYGVIRSVVELYMHYFVFGQTLIDKVALKAGMKDRYSFEFDNYERFLQIIDGSQGVILIGAHVGCWEAGSVFFGNYGKKINIVMFDVEKQEVREALEKQATESNYKIIPVNQGSLEALLQIKIALNEGEYVCFNGDRHIDTTTAVSRNFFGGDALFPIGPFRIAAKCRVPVVFYFSMREKGMKYRFMFTEVTEELRNPDHLLDKYKESLEAIVRKYPRQWFNFYNFWND